MIPSIIALQCQKIFTGVLSLCLKTETLSTAMNALPCKSVVMHGNILNGFLSHFIGECLPIKNVIIHFQDIKYHNPVYLNEALDFYAVVSNTFEAVNAVEFKYVFENHQKIKLAKGIIQIGII